MKHTHSQTHRQRVRTLSFEPLEPRQMLAVVNVLAAGRTGTEQVQLVVDNQTVATFNNIGGNYSTGQFVTLTYNHPTAVAPSQVRVVFTNDGLTPGGVDRNLRVDAIVLDGVRHETESPTVYSTGTYVAPQGRTPGKLQTEYLHLNGYVQYGATGSVLEVRAAGRTGQEQMQLVIGGAAAATFSNVGGNYATGAFQTFVHAHATNVALNQVRVAYTNDGLTTGGVDKNLRVDGVSINNVFHQAEAADVFSTGTFVPEVGKAPGLWQTEYLHANGYLQFASGAVPGTLALGTSLASVDEQAGTVSIPVVRTGGSDGTVGLRYTTVNASATAGSDYTAQTGTVIFSPGQTARTIVIPITNDTLSEPNETFNVASDQTIGGATVGEPRTATITIVDNDGPPPVGNGNGLLGAYFNNADLTASVFERTDATVNFSWGTGSPGTAIGADTFSVRWTGQVEARFTETFAFRTTSDDGVRLWINNQLIIDQWNNHAATDHTGSIALTAGQRYDVRMEYYENTGQAVARLGWSSPSQPFQIIPQSQLYSDPPAPPENGTFAGQTIVTGLSTPTAMDFDASGRMFIAEQQGVVRVYQNGALLSTPFVDIRPQVNHVQDRGLLGVAVHPNFPATPYVYVAYTYDPPEAASNTGLAGRDGAGNRVARVTRFTANAATSFNTAVPGSEVVVVGSNSVWANISHPELDSTNDITIAPSGPPNGEMRDILIADSRSHTVGNVAFGPDGMLYVANGDGTSFGRVDPRTSRVQSLDSLSGKILRVDPITGRGLADNPFFNGDADANRSKVYDYGLRNPFRFAFLPTSGEIFIGDVGWNTWEEINRGRGENFGWPYYEGANGTSAQTGGYRDLPEALAFYATNPDVQAPLWARAHSAGGVAVVAGDFYTGSVYPASYRNALFLSDYGDDQLRVLRLNADGSLNSVSTLGLSVGTVVEMTMGRDGHMYYVDVTGRIGRLTFTPTVMPAAATAVWIMPPSHSTTSTHAVAVNVEDPARYEAALPAAATRRGDYRPAVRAAVERSSRPPAIQTATVDAALERFAIDPFAWRTASI
jgi:glucose/arabinose dehydrogenase